MEPHNYKSKYLNGCLVSAMHINIFKATLPLMLLIQNDFCDSVSQAPQMCNKCIPLSTTCANTQSFLSCKQSLYSGLLWI